VCRDSGRLFQTSGPQTANARRPSSVRFRRVTAAQVDAERRDRRNGSSAQKVTPKFIPHQLRASNSPDLNPVDYRVWLYCKKRCTTHAITDLELSTTPLTNGCHNDNMIYVGHSVLSSSRSVMSILNIFSCNIPHTL